MRDAIFVDSDLESVQSELLLNLITIVKLQQLNIELLWETVASGAAPAQVLADMRESNTRLSTSMERVCGLMERTGPSVN